MVISECAKHSVVVGSGIGGLSIALLLAWSGRRVTLLEKLPRIGGFLQRFHRGGVAFDTGFHFTGGFDNVLPQMLEVLGLDDVVKEAPFRSRIYFGSSERRLELPEGGIEALAEYLGREFPRDRDRIAAYYRAEKEVIEQTPMFDLRDADPGGKLLLGEFDLMTVDDFFAAHGIGGELGGALASAAMCHGTPPCEASMTHHCRVSYGLGNHIARVERGGDAFIDGFNREARKLGIEIRTGCTISRIEARDSRRESHRVFLTDGSEMEFDDAFLTIHPQAILEMMPEEVRRGVLGRRVAGMEESCSFFSIFGVVEPGVAVVPELTSFISSPDLNRILLPGGGERGIGMVTSCEHDEAGREVKTFTAFGSTFFDSVRRWAESGRDAGYASYKEEECARLLEAVYRVYPEYAGRLRIADSSSPLTCRDYSPPTGCAYGVRQKIGEPRLFGRLPVRNFYALGQSALIPGVLGTMMASFLLFRQVVGEACYMRLIGRKLNCRRSFC